MRDARYFREQGSRCRDLLRTAIEPGLIEQLRLWSVELADEADEIVRRRRARGKRRFGLAQCGVPSSCSRL